jgi:putative aldouronate transport system substrate-binding protein
MKKFLAVILILIMVLSVSLQVSAIESKPASTNDYSKHYTYELYSIDDNAALMDFPVVKTAAKKFNVDFKINLVPWDSWDQKTRILVASNNFPETAVWYNLNPGEYKNWASQGVFKALPNLTKYPKLDQIAKNYSIVNKLKVNGKLYAFPKVIVNNPYNEISPVGFLFRRDWAKQAGYNFSSVQQIKWNDFVKYLKDIKKKDPAKLGDKLDLLEPADQPTFEQMSNLWNPLYGKYMLKNGKYVFGSSQPETEKAVKALGELYSQGLVPKDIYTFKNGDGNNRFTAGRAAVLYTGSTLAILQDYIRTMQANNKNFKDSDLGMFIMEAPDGKVHEYQKLEWWASFAFGSKMDDKKLDRFLQIADWTLSTENTENFAYGIKGTDWVKNNNKVELKWPKDASGNYTITAGTGKDYISAQRMFQKFFVLEGLDSFLPGNPAYSPYLQAMFKDRVVKSKALKPIITPQTYDVDFLSTPSKDKYGAFALDTQNAFIKALVSKDPVKTWNASIKPIKSKISTVEAEINKALGK